ncbi:putative Ran exchange factor Prp20/Pim1 [Durotheca rogersii]|uniref:putative Ran exchange factor Prp20/Pim1 n=1 Tax=Durotheca rogersii TaxID=419775 RepID=UPI002220B8F8|nr:putative Ran exchange factor Prp20/Pim1 [Durotheca rogersii]KAI5864013.1 putative Ran exchange factor Prp20/Pim1 [Durotheca rogersii]
MPSRKSTTTSAPLPKQKKGGRATIRGVSPALAPRTRKIKDPEHGSTPTSRDIAQPVRKTTQNKSTGGAIDSEKKNDARSAASLRTNKRKRSLEIEKVDQLTTTPLDVSKRVKTGPITSRPLLKDEQSTESQLPIINKVPIEKLIVLVFGGGDAGELGLGSKQTEALRPSKNPLLDVDNPSALPSTSFNLPAEACIQNSQWDGKLRDIDADSEDEDEDGELNPLESKPMEIPSDCFPPGTRFVQVAAGDSCSFALTDTGLVYGWGTFRDSQGHQAFRRDGGKLVEKQARPIHIQGLQNITQIACGVNHALALDIAGNIWAWGCNDQNQFGRHLYGAYSDPLTPRQVRVCRNKAKYIASGEHHSFAVDRDDNVWAWGMNSFGEAGHTRTAGTNSAFINPTKIRYLCQKEVVVLDGGAHHSAAVTAKGQCYVWGRIDDGQLGIAFTPEQLHDSTLIRYDDRSKPRICLRPTAIPNIQDVVHVACGTDHTIFIDRVGSAYSTGYGFQGQLGLNSTDDVKIAQRITGRNVKDRLLTWAGAGGQFSVIAGPAKIS